MFESNNITITGKSAVLSILYTVVTRQNKQPKEEIKTPTHTHTHTHSSSPPYKNDTRIKPEAQKVKQPPPPTIWSLWKAKHVLWHSSVGFVVCFNVGVFFPFLFSIERHKIRLPSHSEALKEVSATCVQTFIWRSQADMYTHTRSHKWPRAHIYTPP